MDFPIWMVHTLNHDGTVKTDFYSQPRDKVLHHDKQTRQGRWRIRGVKLEFGKLDDAGNFEQEGASWPIAVNKSGELASVSGWTRLVPPATQPATQAKPK